MNSYVITVFEKITQYHYRDGEQSLYTLQQTAEDAQGQPMPGFNRVVEEAIVHSDPDVPQVMKDLDVMVRDYWVANNISG